MATIVSYSGKDLKRMADAVATASTEVMKQYNASPVGNYPELVVQLEN